MAKNKKHSGYPLFIETPINWSGFSHHWQHLPKLRKGYFYKENIDVGGDAPKNFIRVYEYGQCRKKNPRSWVAYVAKVGHKWYPIESITEYLMNRIGEEIGLDIAKPKLVLAGGQIRFLSRYFLDPVKNEQLIHGAQIYARHLEDEEFVEQANERKRNDITRELFTFQFTEEAIKAIFPTHHELIMRDFVAMILFDAIVGNNDRHFYNWGVIHDVYNETTPRFSPIYDTARGLFWNETEDKIRAYFASDKQLDSKLINYVDNAKPRVGWEGTRNLNHFEVIEKIFTSDTRFCDLCQSLVNEDKKQNILRLLEREFTGLMSVERLNLIKRCISLRLDRLRQIIST